MPAKKKNGWKAIQSQKQIAKKTKLALMLLLIVLGILVLAQAVKFTRSLFSPWKQSSTQKNYIWKADYNINVLIRAKGISLLTFSPQNERITIIDLPDSIFFEIPHGFGKWMLSSVFNLGESQKDLGGDRLLADSISSLFALPVDGFMDFSGKFSSLAPADLISEIRKSPISGFDMMADIKTDLTPLELLRLKWGLSSVRFDKITKIDLEKSEILSKEKLADGTEVLVVDAIRLDSVLLDIIDPILQSEHQTIAIFNTTNHPLLAQKAARIITNMGGDVVITSNSQVKAQSTQAVGEKSRTLNRIKQIFEKPVCKPDGKNPSGCVRMDPNLEKQASSRAQINLFLGEDSLGL